MSSAWHQCEKCADPRVHETLESFGWSLTRKRDVSVLVNRLGECGYEVTAEVTVALENIADMEISKTLGDPSFGIKTIVTFGCAYNRGDLLSSISIESTPNRVNESLPKLTGASQAQYPRADAVFLRQYLGVPVCLIGHHYTQHKADVKWQGGVYMLSEASESQRFPQRFGRVMLSDNPIVLMDSDWESLLLHDDLCEFVTSACGLSSGPMVDHSRHRARRV